jgi:hypothetical protein
LHNFWQETSSMKSARRVEEKLSTILHTNMYIHGIYIYKHIVHPHSVHIRSHMG